jgi:hypothetical protein
MTRRRRRRRRRGFRGVSLKMSADRAKEESWDLQRHGLLGIEAWGIPGSHESNRGLERSRSVLALTKELKQSRTVQKALRNLESRGYRTEMRVELPDQGPPHQATQIGVPFVFTAYAAMLDSASIGGVPFVFTAYAAMLDSASIGGV